jgi:hypothetical protein
VNVDTADLAFQGSLGSQGYINLSGTIDIAGPGTASFTAPLFVFGGNGCDCLGFGNFSQGNLIAFFGAGQGIPGYDLASGFGPVVGTNSNLNQFQNVATDLGTLGFTSMSPVTFTASDVPEPPAGALSALSLAGVLAAYIRSRRAARN